MNMKKIMASVAASALAVSAMATAAFADVTKEYTKDQKVANAVFTFSKATTLTTAGTDLTIDIADAEGTKWDQVEKATVKVEYIDKDKKLQTAEKKDVELYTNDTDTADKTIKFTTAGAVGFTDIVNVEDNANIKVTVTFSAKGYDRDGAYNKDTDKGTFKVTLGNTAVATTPLTDADSLTVGDATEEKNGAVNVAFDSAKYTVAERDEIKNAESVTLTLALKDKAAARCFATLKKGDKEYATVVVNKDDTTVTFNLAVADFYNAEYDAFESPTFTWDVNGDGTFDTDMNSYKVKIATLTFVTASDEEGEDTDISDEEGEDTDASLDEGEDTSAEEGEDTAAEGEDTAAEGEDTAAEGSDSKGENPGTGVALAIVPAIVAGAAVVASRKRK